MAAAPNADHQWLSGEVYWKLRDFIEPRGLGVVLFAPLDLLIQREPLRTRQPDVLYLSAERTGVKGRRELRGMQVLEVAPDIVVEVLSPSNSRRDTQEKLEDYRRLGVLECWLVSPEAETMEVAKSRSRGDFYRCRLQPKRYPCVGGSAGFRATAPGSVRVEEMSISRRKIARWNGNPEIRSPDGASPYGREGAIDHRVVARLSRETYSSAPTWIVD